MFRFALTLVLFGSLWTNVSYAATTCPWLTSGTAERLLGGEVSVTANADDKTGGSCRFARQEGANAASIDVLVGPNDTHPCPPDSIKLKALGNEAMQCRHDSSPSNHADQIAGRIRKTFFVVTVTNVTGATKKEPADPHLNDAYAASPIERLAEIVVGNLY